MMTRRRAVRLTVRQLALLVVAVGLGLAAERWLAWRHPDASRRLLTAWAHANEAALWRSAHVNFLNTSFLDHTDPRAHPPYERSTFRPTGVLSEPNRYDATGRPWEYRWGSGHRWLGPADPVRSEAQIRDDFLALCLEKAAYHDRMAARWSQAARFPWFAIGPDPPGPPLVYDPPPSDSW